MIFLIHLIFSNFYFLSGKKEVNLQCNTHAKFTLKISRIHTFMCNCTCSIQIWFDKFDKIHCFECLDSFALLVAAIAIIVCIHLLWKAKCRTDLSCLNLFQLLHTRTIYVDAGVTLQINQKRLAIWLNLSFTYWWILTKLLRHCRPYAMCS